MTHNPFDTVCPPELERDRTLLYLSAGLGVLGLVIVLGAGGLDPLSGLFGFAGIVLQVVLAGQLARGRAWARIVLTIFIALSLVLFLVGIAGWGALIAFGAIGVTIVLLTVVQTAISAVVLMLMWREDATRFLTVRR